ncbi:MAG TPA: MATE family efflux transporter [Acidimicrobiales bacterium]|nr:MATE family efflux transporter [Acidimicrobiales bacterium]
MNAVDRRLLALAIPSLFTLAAEPLYVLADTAIVGHIGTRALGGLGLASIVLTTSSGLCNVLTWWTTSRVGFLRGAGDDSGVQRVAATVLWLACVLGALLVVVLGVGASPVVRALGGHGPVLHDAVVYLRIGVLGMPALLISWAGMGVARGEGDTRSPLFVVVAANVANLLLELWFVYGLHWGIAGSAWGTVVAQWAGAAVFALRLARRAAGGRRDRDELRAIGRVASNLIVRTGALFAALTLASAVAARIDTASLAAHQVVAQLNLFAALVLDSVAIAAQTLVAEAAGAADGERFRFVVARSARLTAFGAAVVAVALVGGTHAIPALFSDDAAVRRVAAGVMPILALMQFPAAGAYLLDGVLMGNGDFVTVRRSTLLGLVAFLVGAAAVLVHPALGLRALWMGLAAWALVRALVNATGLGANRATLSA